MKQIIVLSWAAILFSAASCSLFKPTEAADVKGNTLPKAQGVVNDFENILSSLAEDSLT